MTRNDLVRPGWIFEARHRLADRLYGRARNSFAMRRAKDIDVVIRSSPYLTALASMDRRRAIAKAIQAIKRHPELDDPAVISPSELAELNIVRDNAGHLYWRLHEDGALRSEIETRVGKMPIRNTMQRLHQLNIGKHNAHDPSMLLSVARYYFGDQVYEVDLDRWHPQTYPSRYVTLYIFVCINLNWRFLIGKEPERVIPDHPDPINFHQIRKKIAAITSDVADLFSQCRIVFIMSDSEITEGLFPAFVPQWSDHIVALKARISNYFRTVCVRFSHEKWEWALWSSLEAKTLNQTPPALGADQNANVEGDLVFLREEFSRRTIPTEISVRAMDTLFQLATQRCAMYARQGVFLSEQATDEHAVLIMTEKPKPLKIAMFRSALRSDQYLPMLII